MAGRYLPVQMFGYSSEWVRYFEANKKDLQVEGLLYSVCVRSPQYAKSKDSYKQ